MSKELTEQWQNGTLEKGWYYLAIKDGMFVKDRFDGKQFDVFFSSYIEEVLAPVPTYDQFVELTEKVHILNEANMNLENIIGNFAKQLKEANAIIKSLKDARSQSVNEYLEKWGVK